MPSSTFIEIPEQMMAVAISAPGDPEVLVTETRAVPEPNAEEILIKIAAAGVNRPDIVQRRGAYAPPPGASDLPGLEVSGMVVAKGNAATKYEIGDHVCALTHGGGYAEYVAVHQSHALPVPVLLSLKEAACLPETFFTVWTNVFQLGKLRTGGTLLMHGGASGIGTSGIQIAKAMGCRVIVTAGSDEKCAACQQLGADLVINYYTTDYVEAVMEFTNGKGADVILDMVGGDYVLRNYKAAAFEGRIVQIACINGSLAEANFRLIMQKRLVHTGSLLRPQSIEAKAKIAEELSEYIWPHVESGKIKPVIDRTFKLTEAALAHAHMEDGNHIGKIVLQV